MPARRFAVIPQGGGVPPQTAIPLFSPGAGTYAGPVLVTITCATFGATIYFTLDGSIPNTLSPVYSGPITIPSTETLNAVALANGYTLSLVDSATYTITSPQGATPTFSPVAGNYTNAQSVTLSCSTPSSSMFYTLDGSTPTTSSTPYVSAISVSSSETIKAIATAAGFTQSAVGSATYTISAAPAVVSGIKFAPGYTPVSCAGGGIYSNSDAQWHSDIGVVLANPTKVLNPTATGYMPAYAAGLRWRDLESVSQTTFLNNPAAITTQYPGFTRIANLFNYLQGQFPSTGAYLGFYFNWFDYSQNQTPATLNGKDMSVYYPKYLVNCGGSLTLPNNYGLVPTTTYTLTKPYSTNPGYGWAVGDWNGSFYALQMPAIWDPAVEKIRELMTQALSQFQFTVTAGPLSGNTYTFDTCPFIHFGGTADEDSISFIPTSGDTLNPPSFTNSTNQPTPGNYHGNQKKFIQNWNTYLPHTPWLPCESFGFQGGGSNGQDTNASMAAVVNALLSPFTGQSSCVPWAYSQADTWQNDFISSTPQASQGKLGYLGIASGISPSMTPVPTAQSLQGQAGYAALWEPTDYSNAHGAPNNNNAAAVTALIASSVGAALSGGKPLAQYIIPSLCDNTFITSTWSSYIQPTIAAAAQPSELLPVLWMPVLTGLSGSASGSTVTLTWNALTQWMGRNLSYAVTQDGSAAGTSATGTITLTGVSAGPHNYTVACTNSNGTGPASAVFTVTIRANYVGINLSSISAFSPEFPLLNILKQSTQSGTINSWVTSPGDRSGGQTNEEGWLSVDSDGYVKSLTAINGGIGNGLGGGGLQQFDQVYSNVVTSAPGNPGIPPGATDFYPGGSYTLQFQGAGTLNLWGNACSALSSSTPGITISGTQITSTMTAGNTATVTLTITPSTAGVLNGFSIYIVALPSSTNYLKAMSLVQTSQQASYLAGELFHPLFKATITGYSRIRFMDWMRTNNVDWEVVFTAGLSMGATGGTLSTMSATGIGSTSTFPFPTGTYNFLVPNASGGQVLTVNCTYGSSALTWPTTPLAAALPTSGSGQAFFSPLQSWATRPLLSNCFWSWQGMPAEAMIQLCNEMNADGWFNVPGTVQAINNLQGGTTYATQLAQLLHDGTGANLTGSNISSFTGLKSTQKAYIEYMNEYWNFAFVQANLSVLMGTPLYTFSNYPGWFGSQVALIGQQFNSVFGGAMSSRVVITMSQQSSNIDYLIKAMNTPGWAGGPAYSTGFITAIHTGGYFGLDVSGINGTDLAFLQGLTLTQQVQAYFDLAYSNVSGGHTYTSLSSNGYIPFAAARAASDKAGYAGQPWASLPINVYEGGTSNSNLGGSLNAMLVSSNYDARMKALYYDPTHVLDATGTGFFTRMAATISTINQFADIGWTNGQQWQVLEDIMQVISPLSSAPPKFQSIMNYAV